MATSPWGDGPAYPVQQLVVGIDGERVVAAALFDWDDNAGGFVEIARFEGCGNLVGRGAQERNPDRPGDRDHQHQRQRPNNNGLRQTIAPP